MDLYRQDRAMVLSVLRLFSALPYSILRAWIKYFYQTELRRESVSDLSIRGYLCYEKESDYVYLYRGLKANPRTEILAYVLLKLCEKESDKVAQARYPFDYLFSTDDKNYVLIDFENEGESKLRILKNMASPYALSPSFTPVIVLREGTEHKLAVKDANGNYELIPDKDYVLACYKYNPAAPEYNRYSVKFFKKDAGCL